MRALDGSWELECEATEEFDARVHTATILLLVFAKGTDEIKSGCYTRRNSLPQGCSRLIMLFTARSAAVYGIDAHIIDVEVDFSGIKLDKEQFSTVGLPDAAVRESRDRVRSAIKNSGFEIPPTRITINLAPADLKKEGSGFDLPIAIGILGAYGALHIKELDDFLLVGELGLDGSLRAVQGMLPIAVAAKAKGIPNLIIPTSNAREAAVVQGVNVYPVKSLLGAVELVLAGIGEGDAVEGGVRKSAE